MRTSEQATSGCHEQILVGCRCERTRLSGGKAGRFIGMMQEERERDWIAVFEQRWMQIMTRDTKGVSIPLNRQQQ